MARHATPITLSSRPPEISFDELTTCMAEASAILWTVKERREERLRRLSHEIPTQEERFPKPKGEAL